MVVPEVELVAEMVPVTAQELVQDQALALAEVLEAEAAVALVILWVIEKHCLNLHLNTFATNLEK